MARSVDSDETPRSAASHLGLHYLLRPACPNTYGKYSINNEYLENTVHHLNLCIRIPGSKRRRSKAREVGLGAYANKHKIEHLIKAF